MSCGFHDTKEIHNNQKDHIFQKRQLRQPLQKAGLTLSGVSPDGRLVETVELTGRPFYVGVQYHPEFKSRPNKAHPLFRGFIEAALDAAKAREN